MSAAIAIDSVELLAFNARRAPGSDPRRPSMDQRTAWAVQNAHPDEEHFATRPGRMQGAAKMTNLERGLQVRRALLAVARLCHARSCLFPRYAALGAVIGTDGSNISRHLGMLMDAGALTLINTGCGRALVGSVRS